MNEHEEGQERQRAADYKKKYGITIEEYDARLAAQGGHCALCPSTPKKRRLAVDHDHKTGQVRGLLCYRCNRALPYYVTKEWLTRAIAYIDYDSLATDLSGGSHDTGRADGAGTGEDPGAADHPGSEEVRAGERERATS